MKPLLTVLYSSILVKNRWTTETDAHKLFILHPSVQRYLQGVAIPKKFYSSLDTAQPLPITKSLKSLKYKKQLLQEKSSLFQMFRHRELLEFTYYDLFEFLQSYDY